MVYLAEGGVHGLNEDSLVKRDLLSDGGPAYYGTFGVAKRW